MLQEVGVHSFIVVRKSEYCDESVVAQIAGIHDGVIHAVGEYPYNDLHIPYDNTYFFRTQRKPYDGWEDVTPDPVIEKRPIHIPTPPARRPTDGTTRHKQKRNSKFKIALKIVKDNPTLDRSEITKLFKQQIPGGATNNMCSTYFYKAKKQLENNNDNGAGS